MKLAYFEMGPELVYKGSSAEELGKILYSTNGPYLERKKDKYESRLSQRI